jgi:uncharacterized protein with GYD domain
MFRPANYVVGIDGASETLDQASRPYPYGLSRESIMPTYILMSTLTPDGRQTLHKDPDRLEQVNKEISDFGCRVIAQYAVLGQCDFITVIEASDNETVAHLSVDLGSRGTVNIVSLPAIPMDSLRAKLKGPKQMGRS